MKTFREIGNLMKSSKMRVAMHPDQFVIVNSIDEDIFHRSVRELSYHAEVLDLLETDYTAKIQIHVGGVYGNKKRSLKRFITRHRKLPQKIKQRLVIENDERLYSLEDCLLMHEHTDIPVVFDVLHFRCNNNGERLIDMFSKTLATWSKKDGIPIVDYSSQENHKKIGRHSTSLDAHDFRHFLQDASGFDFDIMCEIKDKEKSALKALHILQGLK
jgi:UV DNA damage endonuclease